MNVPSVACTNCGKPFTTDDLRGTNCRFCGTLLAHHARAQQQVAVVQQMMVDRNGNGIPDVYEGLVANAQANALQAAFGANPSNPYAPPPYGYGAPPPATFGTFGVPAPQVYVDPRVAQVGQQVARTMSTVMIIVVVSIVLVTLLTFGGIFAAMYLAR
jgi:hypothetical protein